MPRGEVDSRMHGGVEVVDLAQRLIRLAPVNPPVIEGTAAAEVAADFSHESAAIHLIREQCEQVELTPVIKARIPSRPNLVCRLSGRGEAPPLLLYGHVDVVPVTGQTWQVPPFDGAVVDGVLWGRGALDMKGGLAMLVSAFLQAARTVQNGGERPPGDLVLVCLVDEETGGDFGAAHLVADAPDLFDGVRHALGEFGGFSHYQGHAVFYPVQVAEKRPVSATVQFRASGGHAARVVAESALQHAAEFVRAIARHREPLQPHPAVIAMCNSMARELGGPGRLLSLLGHRQLAVPLLRLGGQSLRAVFEPMLRSSVQVTRFQSGEADNVIPAQASVTLNIRLLPGDDGAGFVQRLKALAGPHADWQIGDVPATVAGFDASQLPLMQEVISRMDSRGKVVPLLLPGSTDGRHFASLGIQTYGFLPMKLPEGINFLDLIHAADERVPVQALIDGMRAISQFIENYRG